MLGIFVLSYIIIQSILFLFVLLYLIFSKPISVKYKNYRILNNYDDIGLELFKIALTFGFITTVVLNFLYYLVKTIN